MKRIVIIGGGTGSYTALRGLKKYDVELTAVINMMDSGGSAGRLREGGGAGQRQAGLRPGGVRFLAEHRRLAPGAAAVGRIFNTGVIVTRFQVVCVPEAQLHTAV